MKKTRKNNFGFTLIEMLVAIVIFLIIFIAIMNVFVSAVKIQRYSLAYQSLLDQTSYVLEYMTKAVRMAKKDSLGSCVIIAGQNYAWPTANGLMFQKYDNASGTIKCKGFFLGTVNGNNVLNDYEQGRNPESLQLISSKINVKNFNVNVSGDTASEQPKVTIYLEMEETSVTPHPTIRIQTTISQRDLNK